LATSLILSTLPTEVPPNFITSRNISFSKYSKTLRKYDNHKTRKIFLLG